MLCFSCESTTLAIASKHIGDIVTEKLKSAVDIIPNVSYACITSSEGMLLAHATRREVPTTDLLCNISALKPTVTKLLKFYQISGSSVIHLSGNVTTVSVYSINESAFVILSHQCDLKSNFVVDFGGLDAAVHLLMEELRGFFPR
jgi:hypothetical protein